MTELDDLTALIKMKDDFERVHFKFMQEYLMYSRSIFNIRKELKSFGLTIKKGDDGDYHVDF